MTYRMRWWMWPCGAVLFLWFLTLASPSQTPLQRANSGRQSCLTLAKLPDVEEAWMWEHYPRERYVKYVQCMHDTGFAP